MKRIKNFDNNQKVIYFVATPIGNLKEISSRALEVINEATLIACEDTRNTSSLLAKYNIKKATFSLHEHNEMSASQHIINKVLNGEQVVYVSDAGYPAISDPGYLLVKQCISNDIGVSIINGSSAFLTGLIPSGLNTNHFYFYGFLSPKDNECKKELLSLRDIKDTLIFYEAPHRIINTLNNIYEVLGDRKACVARELTKINEEYIRGNLSELINIDPTTLKGEMVIIVEGNQVEVDNDEEIDKLIELLKSKKLSNKDIVEIVTNTYKVNKNKITKKLY